MSTKLIVEFPEGKKLYFGAEPETELDEVGMKDLVRQASSDTLKAAFGTLGDLVNSLEDSIGKLPNRPDKVELEFNATLTHDCNLWIVSGEVEAAFKVKLAWDKSG